MPPRRRGAAPPPNPWTHLDAQGRHLPGVIAEAPLADDGSIVESCFGGRDLVELYVKERDQALEYGLLSDAELLAKQAWWARGCNWTAPASGGEKDGRHKRKQSVFKDWLDAQKAELKRLEKEQPIQTFFSRILAFFFIAAIIRAAIKGPDPPAG
jgi:hypothetical protein